MSLDWGLRLGDFFFGIRVAPSTDYAGIRRICQGVIESVDLNHISQILHTRAVIVRRVLETTTGSVIVFC